MKKLLLSLLTVGSVVGASAQITVISSQLKLAVSPDTAFSKAITAPVDMPTVGASQTWDYSAAVTGPEFSTSWLPSDTALGFSGTQGMYTYNPSMGVLSLTGSKGYYKQDANGRYYSGFSTAEQTINLFTVTGDADDSVYFPLSINSFGSAAAQYSFPITSTSVKNGSYRSITPFSLTVGMAMLSNTPGDLRQDVTYSDSVVGYGKLILPGGDTVNALLIKHFELWVDSIYLGGAPAPAQLLGFFGLTQGDQHYNCYYDFVTTGLERSAMRIWTDETFNNFDGAEFSTEEPEVTSNISKMAGAVAMKVYPNPASQQVVIDVAGINGNVTADIYSAEGRNVGTRNIENGTLSLNGLQNGTYMVKVNGDNFVGYFRVVKVN